MMGNARDDSYDIVVVGAGPIGASLTCCLAQWASRSNDGLRIALIESRASELCYSGEQFDPRVVALTESSRLLLESLGLWETMCQLRVCPIRQMQVWDGEGTGHIEFDCAEVRAASLGHIVENSVINHTLRQAITSLKQVEFICPASVESIDVDNRVEEIGNRPIRTRILHLDNGRTIRTNLLVAADGAQSRIRRLAAIETREWAYGHQAIVSTIRTGRPHGNVARQRFTANGPLAFLPLQDKVDCHYTSIVWSQNEIVAEQLMAMNDEAFRRELAGASEFCLGNVETVAQRFSIPLRQRHALAYVVPGLALLGDAAHSIHPLAGQGVNLGFKDVEVLAEELKRAIRSGINPGHIRVLQRYQRRRKADNLAMMAAMEGFKRLFEADAPFVRLARNVGMSQLNRWSQVKKHLIRHAMGL